MSAAETLAAKIEGTGLQAGQVQHFSNICLQAGNSLISTDPTASWNWFLRAFNTSKNWKLERFIVDSSSGLLKLAMLTADYSNAAKFIHFVPSSPQKDLTRLILELQEPNPQPATILQQFFSREPSSKHVFALLHILKSNPNFNGRLELLRQLSGEMKPGSLGAEDYENCLIGLLLFLSEDGSQDYGSCYALLIKYVLHVSSLQPTR